jgi:hypothetical protein
MEKFENSEPLAIDVVPAGRLANMNPQQSYRAAREGFMPVILVGKSRKKVPLAKWRAILNGEVMTA